MRAFIISILLIVSAGADAAVVRGPGLSACRDARFSVPSGLGAMVNYPGYLKTGLSIGWVMGYASGVAAMATRPLNTENLLDRVERICLEQPDMTLKFATDIALKSLNPGVFN